MTVTAHAPVLRTGDLWHGRYGPALALGLVILPFALVLVWAASRPAVDQATLATSIRDTAAVVDDHATAMIGIGERMAAAPATAGRATWMAYAQHMISDGQGLRALGERLRQTATVAQADQLHRGSVDVAAASLQARWEELRADGRATAQHGRVMVQMADDLSAGVAAGVLTDADVREIRRASAGMAEAGDQVVRCADMLLASTSQMQRWMGAGR